MWKQTKEALWYWRLAIGRCGLKMTTVFMGTFMASLKGLVWTQLTFEDKLVMLGGSCLAAAGVLDAFLDTTMQQLSDKDRRAIAAETSTVNIKEA